VTCSACGGGPLLLKTNSVAVINLLNETETDQCKEMNFDDYALTQVEQTLDLFIKTIIGKKLKTSTLKP
jgi:hypothetical protein